MPAFVTDGPDIPERLLQAHEEGRVVFFCGAGISTPAGLPLFGGMVDGIYEVLGTSKTAVEDRAYKNGQYDATLDQLERRYPGQRIAIRSAVSNILKPKWRRKNATATHRALLQLATDRKGKVRLVTTNFDRIFQYVIKREKIDIPHLTAPLLPVPKPSRWNGIVYLHGLLPEVLDETELNRLVLSSGDFGLAYLTERWASRFVSELFRYYVVCFVGYGINDPVMRYMMDALAADELLGEVKPEAYAFACYHDGVLEETIDEWTAKGVTPLLYKVSEGSKDHAALHRSLKEWADTYRDGIRGKEMIIAQHATTPPLASSRSDFAVGRVLWALTDGLAARHFADLEPVPPLEWLGPLSEAQFNQTDLCRFGIALNSLKDEKLSFSVIQRPAPYTHATWMQIAHAGSPGCNWDEVMYQLARWLTRHLNDPNLLLWLAGQGGRLHQQFSVLIRDQIEELEKLEREGNNEELERTRAQSPNAIPNQLMRTLWRLVWSGRLKAHSAHLDLHDWVLHFDQDGLTPTLRISLRELMTPCVILRKPMRWIFDQRVVQDADARCIKDLVDWELTLPCNHVYSLIEELAGRLEWQAALPQLLPDFTILLRDALDLMSELGGANEQSDSSYFYRPSVEDHSQNRHFRGWTVLIDLVRDAWLAMARTDPAQARIVAEGWVKMPYPLFKRLAFFAATQHKTILSKRALDWLLAEGGWWLWSVETKRETIRLVVELAKRLDKDGFVELERSILRGPPRPMDNKDLPNQEWKQQAHREIWLRLAKVQAAGVSLTPTGRAKWEELSRHYSDWTLAENERDEFPHWTGDGDESKAFLRAPSDRRTLMQWLANHSRAANRHHDGWWMRCREDFPATATALCGLAQKSVWPIDCWSEALQAWAEEPFLRRSWRYMASTISAVPDHVFAKLSPSLSCWLRAQAKTFDGQEDIFFKLTRRVYDLYGDDGIQHCDPKFSTTSHPIGYTTQALLDWWYRYELKDAQGLQSKIKAFFSQLCDTQNKSYRHGRVLLAAHTIALFRTDEDWVREYLLPLFDWRRSAIEARGAWQGFLWSPRLYKPLLSAIKRPFLETSLHYETLGRYAKHYAAFLTFAAMDPGDSFTVQELAAATRKLPPEGLHSAAQTLVRALEGAKEQRGEYWRNRILPYVLHIWPTSIDSSTSEISETIGRLCIAAQDGFPEAVSEMQRWLLPQRHPEFLLRLLYDAHLCHRYPLQALHFLDTVIGEGASKPPRELTKCLNVIEHAREGLVSDKRFVRLRGFLAEDLVRDEINKDFKELSLAKI